MNRISIVVSGVHGLFLAASIGRTAVDLVNHQESER
jgi:hypothetical protein